MGNEIKIKIGDKFSRLTVIGYVGKSKRGERLWKCKCECGKTTNVITARLLSGKTRSCGCLQVENLIKISQRKKHGKRKLKEYYIWTTMKQRCCNPKNHKYKDYGGRGIKICDRWLHNFENFYSDMGVCPNGMSIDRIDVNGDYCPENCRWADSKTQSNNKRNSIKITYNGISESLNYWSNVTGISKDTLYARFHVGKWSAEKALTTPIRRFIRGSYVSGQG